MLNILVGGMYIVFANNGDFPEGLSLLHLSIGIACFLSAAIGTHVEDAGFGIFSDTEVGEDE